MKNNFGLRDTDLITIKGILTKYPQIQHALIFGSRAKGNYKTGSDVDIALKGILDFNVLSQISYFLNEETSMPYKFDILIYETIQEPALKDHIDRVGVEFYSI